MSLISKKSKNFFCLIESIFFSGKFNNNYSPYLFNHLL